MFHIPMSSPMMTRMLGLFACAKTLLTENVTINAIETANIAVNVDLVGFIDPNFGGNALCAILDLSLMRCGFSGPLSRNGIVPNECYETYYNRDENNLYLNANIQEEQRGWDVILRQAHSTERAGKPETMQRAENKRHDSGRARSDSRSPFAL